MDQSYQNPDQQPAPDTDHLIDGGVADFGQVMSRTADHPMHRIPAPATRTGSGNPLHRLPSRVGPGNPSQLDADGDMDANC